MTKQEQRMDLLYTIAEIHVSKKPMFIDLSLDLWNFLTQYKGIRPVHRDGISGATLRFWPIGFIQVFLTNNGMKSKIFLSYRMVNKDNAVAWEHEEEIIDYYLDYDD